MHYEPELTPHQLEQYRLHIERHIARETGLTPSEICWIGQGAVRMHYPEPHGFTPRSRWLRFAVNWSSTFRAEPHIAYFNVGGYLRNEALQIAHAS